MEVSLPRALDSRISLSLLGLWTQSGILYYTQANWLELAFLSHSCPALFLWTQLCFEHFMVHFRKRLSRACLCCLVAMSFTSLPSWSQTFALFLELEALLPDVSPGSHSFLGPNISIHGDASPLLLIFNSLISLPRMKEHGWEQAIEMVKACSLKIGFLLLNTSYRITQLISIIEPVSTLFPTVLNTIEETLNSLWSNE